MAFEQYIQKGLGLVRLYKDQPEVAQEVDNCALNILEEHLGKVTIIDAQQLKLVEMSNSNHWIRVEYGNFHIGWIDRVGENIVYEYMLD